MKGFPTQQRLHYFVLSNFILVSLRGVTSQDVISINYMGPGVVSVGTKIIFTGTTTSAIPGALPTSFSFYGRKTGDSTIFQICDVNYNSCGARSPPCYCTGKNGKNGNIYNFTMEDTATLERSKVFIRGSIGGSDLARYPEIRAQTTTKPPTTVTSTTITTTPGTSIGPTDVTNDNVTFTTVTTGVGGDSVSPTVTVSTTPQIDTTDGPTTETTTGAGDHTDHTGEIVGGVCGGLAGIALGICIYCICKKKKVCCWKGAPVTSDQPSDSPAEEASTVHSTNHNALTSSKPEDKVEMTGEKKKKKSKKSTNAGSPKKKKKDFENGEKKMDENEPRCLPQPEPVAEPGLSTSLSNPEALKSNFATTRLSSPPSNTRPTSIEMTSAPRPLPSPRNPNM